MGFCSLNNQKRTKPKGRKLVAFAWVKSSAQCTAGLPEVHAIVGFLKALQQKVQDPGAAVLPSMARVRKSQPRIVMVDNGELNASKWSMMIERWLVMITLADGCEWSYVDSRESTNLISLRIQHNFVQKLFNVDLQG